MNILGLRHIAVAFLIVFGTSFFFPAFAQKLTQRTIAITIDDLPAGASQFMTAGEILEMTTKLVATLHDQKVPAVGFVNEQKLYKIGEVDDRIKALNLWSDDGLELGNHTFAHTSLNRVTLAAWEEEVIRGETVTRLLLAQHKMKLRYLRHPYLDTGRDIQTRREAEAFLSSRGYQIAPITMDPWDWMYAPVYEDARKRGDTALQQRLVSSYLDYAKVVFDYNEKLSRDLFGYEPSQIILLHANWLEADHIGELLDLLRKRGYQIVTLEVALSDGAYSSPDEYVGNGTGWIDHWAVTRGRPAQDTPVFPQWVIDLARPLRRPPSESVPY
ncbi:MAG TPA: polysaccharide deacetylase family protein [Candidatus Limnocylindrales bacterium]|nr:polysaccharide deacetylase family protein [Candidatus Limnocylindrales bacterium]